MHWLSTLAANIDRWDVIIVIVAVVVTTVVVRIKKAPDWNYDHFWQNLDKFILLFLFMLCLLMVMHILHHGSDNSLLSWIENTSGQVLSALLAVLGARQLLNRGSDKNGNGNGNGTPTPVPADTKKVTTDAKPETTDSSVQVGGPIQLPRP